MADAIMLAALIGPVFLILGLSMLFYAPSWKKLVSKWQKDHYALLPIMMLYGLFGLYIINTYNVWDGTVWVLVTISGWAMFIKFVAYFLLPGATTQGMMKLGTNQSILYLGGLVVTVMGAALSYYTYMA